MQRCGALHVPVADLYRTAGFNAWNFAGTEQAPGPLSDDGLHPNAHAGLDRLIDRVARAAALLL